jgi:hypothetical protein
MLENVGKNVEMVGYFDHKKDVRTKNGKAMWFGTWLDSEGKFFDSTDFGDLRGFFRGKGVYRIFGRVILDFARLTTFGQGFSSVEVLGLERVFLRVDGRNG